VIRSWWNISFPWSHVRVRRSCGGSFVNVVISASPMLRAECPSRIDTRIVGAAEILSATAGWLIADYPEHSCYNDRGQPGEGAE